MIAAALLAAATVLGMGAPAAAAPARGDSSDKPVYLIMGYWPDGGCNTKWNPAISAMRSGGWTGKFHEVGYYATDNGKKGCTRIDPGRNGTADTPLKTLGRQLAWDIYNRYSSKGQSVDIVTHSMGGLIARAALTGYQRHESGWPPKLYVEDVATLGAPMRGAWGSLVCSPGSQQCRDIAGASSFMNWLGPTLPQADQGTDWTLIASHYDGVTGPVTASPEGTGAPHLVRYAWAGRLGHSDLRTKTDGTFRMNYSNDDGVAWRHIRKGASPIQAAMNAIYWSKAW